MPDFSTHPARYDYQEAFNAIYKNFCEILEYIHPHKKNLKTFSHRLFALYLRICTEFESICKHSMFMWNIPLVGNGNIYNYQSLEQKLALLQYKVRFIWEPQSEVLEPFIAWNNINKSPGWYSSYNQVKHNRQSKLHLANIANVREALAGLSLIMHCANILPTESESRKINPTPASFEEYYIEYPKLVFLGPP